MKKIILIVEDELHWQAILRHFLEGEGYSVEIAGSYGDARTQLQHKRVALVIADLQLGSENPQDSEGMEVVKDAYRRGICSLILTGHGSKDLAKRAFDDYNVVGFLSKEELDPSKFLELIKLCLDDKRATETQDSVGKSAGVNNSVQGFMLARGISILDKIIWAILSSLVLYAFGVITSVISVNPLDWFRSLNSAIYVVLSVIAVILVILVYTLLKQKRSK